MPNADIHGVRWIGASNESGVVVIAILRATSTEWSKK